MARPRSAEAGDDINVAVGEITYVDKSDYWEVHDDRLGDDRVTIVAKTQRDVPLPEAEQKKLAERIDAENEAENVRKEAAEAQAEAPSVKDDDILVGTRGAEG